MIRFVDGEKPHKLINYVFSIKIVKNKTGDKNDYIADPVQIFPKESCDQSILKSVQLFSFPDRAAIESQCFFTFVIGNPSTDFQLGFVLYYTYFDACCVLSDYYYPDMFNHLLSLEKSEMLLVCEEMGKERTYDSFKKTNHFTIKGKDYLLDGGSERQQLTKLLFTTFPAYDISKIIIGMLSARHVFVVAGNASTCSLFAAALPILIEPFFWDLNLIPILPLKIIEMIDVPVPAMIGITRSELLQTDSIAPHICVNCDTKHVLDSPVFEQSNISLRLEVVKKQLDFHTQINLLLNEWSKSPGFPHKLVLEKVMRFVSYYLQLYAGDCMSSVDFLKAVKTKLPDFLLNSQIVNQLLILDDLDNKKKELFKKWFNNVFIKDAAEELKKNNEVISEPYAKRNSNPLLTIPQQPQIQSQQQNSLQKAVEQQKPQQASQIQQSQLRSTQPITPQPMQLQTPQRSVSGNLQTQQVPTNRSQVNPSQYNSNPIPNSNTGNIKQQPPPPYLQKKPPTAASSYSIASPLSQPPQSFNIFNSNTSANTNPIPKQNSNNSASIQSKPSYPTKPPANRSFNESNPLMDNPFSSDSFKFNSSDASPNNSLPSNNNLTLAQLSNVSNPNGDLLISFSSSGSITSNNSINNMQMNSSTPATRSPTTTSMPPTNRNSTNFEIFNRYNQQKMQQAQQMRQTQPYQQNNFNQGGQPNRYSQTLVNPFQTATPHQQPQASSQNNIVNQFQQNSNNQPKPNIQQNQQYQQNQPNLQYQQNQQYQRNQQNPQNQQYRQSQQYPQYQQNQQFQQYQQNQQYQSNQKSQQPQQYPQAQQPQQFQQNQQLQQRQQIQQTQQNQQQSQQNLPMWARDSQNYAPQNNNNNNQS